MRANRLDIRPVLTLTTAGRYVLPALSRALPPGSRAFEDALWVPRWRDGELFVFGNGSIVSWGLDEDGLAAFRREAVHPAVEIDPLSEPETEELEFVTDPNESTRLQGDLIILGHQPELAEPEALPQHPDDAALSGDTFAARYAFSQALARSTALSALEEALETYLTSVSQLPHTLATTGKPGLSRRQLIVKLGELLKFRQGLNLNRENFGDMPDFYWTEPVLEGYFNSMSNALDIKQRVNAVNSKITYAGEMQSTLRELLTERSSHSMELIIILLISVEVIFVLIHNGPDLMRAILGREKPEAEEVKRQH
ncbi:hypothetical protein AURDEDRAFT_107564 [Auricularia subglabra TFB-10046 SS5]|uniref:DUF155 domain-containing protein n=1 Tax=Auricularia subglabra (strain TFB-10046 / SS5) TaxID=717982 RepID=J0WVQ4_AURST|nr:hypothetical protein AURDEDRAFT_107564 [Auricularia subglabra TFB-10046 SS5]